MGCPVSTSFEVSLAFRRIEATTPKKVMGIVSHIWGNVYFCICICMDENFVKLFYLQLLLVLGSTLIEPTKVV